MTRARGATGAPIPPELLDQLEGAVGFLSNDGRANASLGKLAEGEIFADPPQPVRATPAVPRSRERLAPLTRALDDPSAMVRRHALTALARCGVEAAEALVPIVRRLGDRSPAVRVAAARALIAVEPGAGRVITSLVEWVDAGDVSTAIATWTLRGIGDAVVAAVPDLVRRLAGEDAGLRDAVRRALARIGDAASASLTEALRDDDPERRAGAAWALGEIGRDAGRRIA